MLNSIVPGSWPQQCANIHWYVYKNKTCVTEFPVQLQANFSNGDSIIFRQESAAAEIEVKHISDSSDIYEWVIKNRLVDFDKKNPCHDLGEE